MPSRMTKRGIPRALAIAASLSLALQPLGSDAAFYYRNVAPEGTRSLGSGTTDPASEPVKGTGDLSVYAATGARARPGVPFSLAPSVQGASGTVSWANVGAALPVGLGVSPSTGAISGSPGDAAVGSYPGIMLRATDGTGSAGTTQPIAISVVPRPNVTVPGVPAVAAGAPVSIVPGVADALGSQAWAVSGPLPLGLSLDPATGVISGATSQVGTFQGLVLTVSDSDGARGASAPFSIAVTSPMTIGGIAAAYGARTGKPMPAIQPSVSGAQGAVAWSLSAGTLPPGLSVATGSGAITGTPTQAGTYAGLVLKATDTASGAAVSSSAFSLTVGGGPVASLTTLAYYARAGAPVSIAPTATGLVGTPRWVLNGGALPAGLALDTSTGAIAGSTQASSSLAGLSLTVYDLYDGSSATTPAFSLATLGTLALADVPPQTAEIDAAFALAPPSATGLGGTATWSLQGTLPAGLAFDPATGSISGTPTVAAAPASLRFALTDGYDGVSTTGKPFTLAVAPVGTLAISGVGPSYVAYTGQPFSLAPALVGGKTPASWSIGALPSWASLDGATGLLSGTPANAEPTLTVQISAQDATGKTASSPSFTLATVAALSVAYAPGSAAQGTPFALSPSVAAAQGAVAFSLASGTLPDGLSLDPATGRISGTTFAAGSYPLAVSATDGRVTTRSNAFVVTVAASGYSASIPVRPAAQPGQPFSAQATATGFAGAVTWSVATGTLPPWASLAGGTGTVSGTPGSTGFFGPIVLEAADASGNRARTNPFSVVVAQTPVLGATMADAAGAAGTPLSVQAQATNSQGAVTWTLSAGTLPAGLTLTAATGVVSGTPASPGTASGLVLKAADASGATASTAPFSISVAAAQPLTLALAATSYQATVGRRFASAPPAVGNALNGLTLSLAGGTLPAWAVLDAATGVVSGTPPGAGSIGTVDGLRLAVADGAGRTATSGTFSIQVSRTPLSASGGGSFALHPGAAYAGSAPSASNALGTVTWSISPPLPAGLAIDPATGAVSGTLSASASPGVASYVVTATDSADGSTATAGSVQGTVLGTPTVAIPATTSLRYAASGSIVPQATNAVAPLKWKLASGTLPQGLALDAATGTISGVPAAPGTTSGLSLSVTDAQNATGTSAAFSIEVLNNLSVAFAAVASPPPPQRVGVAWTAPSPVPTNAIGAVFYDLASGTLPPGITLTRSTGVVSGKATSAFSGSVTLLATDASGGTATTPALDVSMGAAPTVSQPDIAVRVGAPVSIQPAVANVRTNPFTFTYGLALSGGTLPPGLALGYANGSLAYSISGTPSATASVSGLVLTATDYDGAVGASSPFSVTVTPGITIAGLQPSYAGRAGYDLPVSVQPTVGNAKGTVTWGLNPVPAGLTFSTATGVLSGKPSAAFSGAATLTATDAFDNATVSAAVNLAISPALVATAPPDLYTHVGMAAATAAPGISGQKGPSVSWSSVGTALPAYATVASGTGVVSLLNPTLGTVTGVRLQAQDSADQATGVTGAFSINVLPAPKVSGVPTSYVARIGSAYASSAPTLANAYGATTWKLASGTLPAWAKLNPDGTITGTPTGTGALGTTGGLSLTGADSLGASDTSATFSLGVYSQPTVTLSSTNSTGKLRVGDSYTLTPTPSGIAGTPGWGTSLSSGTLPQGITQTASNGVVSGVVGAPGSATFTVVVTDSGDGSTGSSPSVSLTASPALAMSAIPDMTAHTGQTFITTPVPAPTGLVGAASYALTPAVPAGMNAFQAATGVLSGIPTGSPGSTTFTQTVTDAFDGKTASTTFKVTIVAALAFSTQPGAFVGNIGDPASNVTPVLTGVLAPSTKPATFALMNGSTDISATLGDTCAGLQFSTAQGGISGMPTATCGLTGLTVVATDPTDGGKVTSAAFPVQVTPASAVTLDPNKTASGWSLSTNKLTATNTVSARITSLATTGHKSGDGAYYWEVQTNGLANGDDVNIGLSNVYTKILSDTGSGGPGWSFAPSYDFMALNGTNQGNIPLPKPGSSDTAMLAWNGSVLWVGVNGTWLNGNPNAGTGGYGFTSGSAVYPGVSLGKPNSAATFRFRGFKYAPPPGFVGWQ